MKPLGDLRLAYHKTWLNSLGGEWLTGVQIGNKPNYLPKFTNRLTRPVAFSWMGGFPYQREPLKIWQNNKNIADYKVDEVRLDLMSGMQVGMLGAVRLGWTERHREANLETGTTSIERGSKTFGGWVARVDFDQFDRLCCRLAAGQFGAAISIRRVKITARPNWKCACRSRSVA